MRKWETSVLISYSNRLGWKGCCAESAPLQRNNLKCWVKGIENKNKRNISLQPRVSLLSLLYISEPVWLLFLWLVSLTRHHTKRPTPSGLLFNLWDLTELMEGNRNPHFFFCCQQGVQLSLSAESYQERVSYKMNDCCSQKCWNTTNWFWWSRQLYLICVLYIQDLL